MGYTGSVALVTGAGSGMGARAARRLAATGAKVAALDLNAEGLAETARGYETITTFAVDVTDAAAVASIVRQVEADLGPIDRVVSAAGIMPTGRLLEMDTALIHKITTVNFGGTVNVVKAAMPPMLERRRGEVVIFGSMSGLIPGVLMGAYNASKAAVIAFAEVLVHENRDSGVDVVCVCPPLVDTPLLAAEKAAVGTLKNRKALSPDQVLDAVESGLERGRFLVFADRQSKVGSWVRRLAPGVVWRVNHRDEGF
ncbi:MAG: SDR family NAD(P)-dependent oxidoreductase [Acidimicrobiales bacterium]